MLDIKNLDQVKNETLKQLVMEFRKHQVSRFPIELAVTEYGHGVAFVDSRFPTDRWNKENMVAMLHLKTNEDKPTIVLESRLINNDKYAQYNDEYYTKSTKDPKKMLKLMKDYIKPFTAHEIAKKSMRQAESKFDEWKHKPTRDLRNFRYSIQDEQYLETFQKLKDMGVAPVTDLMKSVYETALPSYIESMERTKKNYSDMCHVYFNPDESLFISRVGIDAGKTVAKLYESIEDAPKVIQDNVAMLRMVEADVFVPLVGYKSNDKAYWVEGYPEDTNA